MECRKLEITLVSANNLPDVRSIGRMKVYAKVSTTGKSNTSKETPADMEGETNPRWNFTVGFLVSESAIQQPATQVVVELFCKRTLGQDRLVGEVKIPIKSLFDKGAKANDVMSYKVCGTSNGRLNILYSFGKTVLVQKQKPSEGQRTMPSRGLRWKNALEEGLLVLFDVAILLLGVYDEYACNDDDGNADVEDEDDDDGDAEDDDDGNGEDEDDDDDGDAENEDDDDYGDAEDDDDGNGEDEDDDDDGDAENEDDDDYGDAEDEYKDY